MTNGAGKTVTYQYNDVGLVSRLTTPGSLNFDYTYNALNQLSSVLNPNGVTVSFSYDNGGRLSRITRPGSYIDYQYNARDWITAVLNRTTGGATRYDASYYYSDGALWDHTGNPLKRTENWGSGAWTTTLRYDNVYRLTEETLRDSGGVLQYTHTYGYDQVGNRTLRNDGGTRSLGHYYDANDKLLTTRWVGGGPPGPITANFYYDGAGNITSVTGTEFGAWTMTYDDESRLKTVTSPAGSESFVYNALGQRMQLTVGGTPTKYVYDGDRVLEETDNAGAVLARYTTAAGSYYAPLLHLWRASGPLSRVPMYDLTGSVRGLLDAGGAVTDTYSLELFGKQRSSTGSTPNPYRFGGAWGYINGGSGLQQLGARFHWPDIGRFIQQDPIGDGMNWYAYVGNNPAGSFDADGARETTPGCAQAIREAETAQKEIERRLAEMERYNPSTPPRVVWPRGPFDPDNYADAGGGGVVLCGGKRSTRGKTPEQIHSGHKRQVESWQQRLKNKLREIDEKCSEEDKKEHAARIGKLRPWVTKPVPGFAGAVPVVPLPGLGGLAPVPAPAAPVAPPAGPLMPLRVPIWGFA